MVLLTTRFTNLMDDWLCIGLDFRYVYRGYSRTGRRYNNINTTTKYTRPSRAKVKVIPNISNALVIEESLQKAKPEKLIRVYQCTDCRKWRSVSSSWENPEELPTTCAGHPNNKLVATPEESSEAAETAEPAEAAAAAEDDVDMQEPAAPVDKPEQASETASVAATPEGEASSSSATPVIKAEDMEVDEANVGEGAAHGT